MTSQSSRSAPARSCAGAASSAASAPRRRFIGLLGGGVVLAATAPLAACSSGVPSAAVQPWAAVPDSTDIRRWMLAHALLAPNPHNRQPWRADLRQAGEIRLQCDGDRLLPKTDPFGRQILIGCGAFIELAVLAAAERGVAVQVQLFPDGEPGALELPAGRTVARLRLQEGAAAARDPLFAQIRRRHTHKGPYDNQRSVSAADWTKLLSTATLNAGAASLSAGAIKSGDTTDAARLAQLRQLTRESWEAEMLTPEAYLESAHLMRIGPSEINQHRDGISITGAMPRLAAAVGLFDRFELPTRGSSNFQRVMERWATYETGSGYLWLASRGNSRSAQVLAGRAYVRTHLQATALGIHMHPLSQALQEFAAVKPQYEAVHQLLGFDPATHTVQMLARVGYGQTPATPSPRRDLQGLMVV